MATQHQDGLGEARLSVGPMDPNYPETSGTTLPLLAALLAGFAVTTIVQLMLSPATDGLATASVLAVAAFLIAIVCFLSTIVFSIKAQASNYLPFLHLSPSAAKLLDVADPTEWIRQLERRWFTFFAAALASFYCGTGLFLAALALIVWVHVGVGVLVAFAIAVSMLIGAVILLDLRVRGRR